MFFMVDILTKFVNKVNRLEKISHKAHKGRKEHKEEGKGGFCSLSYREASTHSPRTKTPDPPFVIFSSLVICALSAA